MILFQRNLSSGYFWRFTYHFRIGYVCVWIITIVSSYVHLCSRIMEVGQQNKSSSIVSPVFEANLCFASLIFSTSKTRLEDRDSPIMRTRLRLRQPCNARHLEYKNLIFSDVFTAWENKGIWRSSSSANRSFLSSSSQHIIVTHHPPSYRNLSDPSASISIAPLILSTDDYWFAFFIPYFPIQLLQLSDITHSHHTK